MARFLIEDPTTGLFLRAFGGLNSDHFWTADPEAAWSSDDPRTAAYFAGDPYDGGVRRPFKIKRLVISTRDVPVEPYTREEYWARTERSGPREAFSVPCPQCRAKKNQPCIIHVGVVGGRPSEEGSVHGLRRRNFLNLEIAKAAKTGRPNPYAGQRP